MCGIAGALAPHPSPGDELQRLTGALYHRGPDDCGTWADEEAGIALAHTRLSIIDVSAAGHQPMRSPGQRYVIAFNGEIYNHNALRAEVEAAVGAANGRRAWIGHSDTETLLACFEAWGIEATIRKAVGMFAFALWDRQARTLTLGRDRLGEKPLYYGWQGDTLLFASELKAMRQHSAFRGEIDRDALASYMRYSYVPSPKSIYRGINKLPAGTLLTIRRDGARSEPVPYWSLSQVAQAGVDAPFQGSDQDAVVQLETLLGDAVGLQQVADVPVGAFLSGGIDSSVIVALMQQRSSRQVHTFTIGFHDRGYDEAVHAREVAQHLGTKHTELYATPEEALAVIGRLPTLYDEPFADSSQIPTFLVSQLARRHVTVSLSGDGGDELFLGYDRYMWARQLLSYPATLRRLTARALTVMSPQQWTRLTQGVGALIPQAKRLRMPGDRAHKVAALLDSPSDAAIYHHLISSWADADGVVIGGSDARDVPSEWNALSQLGSAENRMMALDATAFLTDDILCKVDRAAMGVSLETRVPYLDHRVVEFAWTLPLHMKVRDGQGKWVLRQLLDRHVPRRLFERPKMGFAVPIDAWLRGPLRDWAEALLSEDRIRRDGFLQPAVIRRMWREHMSGERNWQYRLWTVLMFQAWLDSVTEPKITTYVGTH
jgi:asparagine synthase (glutamine-hydrolysing)